MSTVFSLDSISAGYGDNIVLRDVNFAVEENDFVGVIGPNGGGKTTLIKLILGLVKPYSGRLSFNEEIVDHSRIGYLPQLSTGDHSFPITVYDVVLSGLMLKRSPLARVSRSDKQRVNDIMDELGVGSLRKASLSQLSGGQLQRVFLGRAIVGDPSLLLLDEPANFVDSTFERDFYDKLQELNKRMTILMVSHDIGIISPHVKSYACVNGTLHYHPSSEITNEQLIDYGCPIQLLTHGEVPHTVLKRHND